ncbi:MAG: hypothetical protein KC420_13735 [Myxococcales bacterium]|nr:hypothetical protein [Myxococcales bacterium]
MALLLAACGDDGAGTSATASASSSASSSSSGGSEGSTSAAGESEGDTTSGGASTSTGASTSDGSATTTSDTSDASGTSDTSDTTTGGVDPGESKIKHVVVFIQENHSFDNYFGRYCKAPAGSEPACTTGPECCEAAPDLEPSGSAPFDLDDALNASRDPDHTQPCELAEINGGLMDGFVVGPDCADPKNFAIANGPEVAVYHQWAAKYAIADRYFQPIVGQSSANDMYFAVARKQFTDNEYKPDSNGQGCIAPLTDTITFNGVTTIGDLLIEDSPTPALRFGHYAEGYQDMLDSFLCPLPPADCPAKIPTGPCDYDCSDNPFQYYEQWQDNLTFMHDFAELADDLEGGTLPAVAFVKPVGYHNEHPGYGTTISDGSSFVKAAVDKILASQYADDTLILVTWDEGGGFFDHVSPPPANPIDGAPYGTRIPLIAIGKFARKNHVSHVVMEHSSIVKFIEFNFLGDTGQLGNRDTNVNNIGSLLDPAETGIVIPEE